MASALYPKFKENCLTQATALDFDTDTIKVTLVSDSDYTYSAAHDYFDDVTDYTGVTPDEIDSKTMTSGAFDSSATPTFTELSIDGAKTVDALVIYFDTGVAGTSLLIAYIDLTSSVTPNGGDITITWDSSPSYIFSL